MTGPEHRKNVSQWIDEAVSEGARLAPACEVCGLTPRTLQRWKHQEDRIDRRTCVVKTPHNRLDSQTRQRLLDIANAPGYADLPPGQIVPKLADTGEYIASESTFYRFLKQADQLTHRHASRPRQHQRPAPVTAWAPNQVYSWDITYLPLTIIGKYCYLYLFIDLYSRKIVGWQVYATESAELSASLLEDIILREGVARDTLTVHSDNGAAMKGMTMLTKMERLGVMPSFSRPAVSDDNPYVESFFKTLKYAPVYPGRFDDLTKAREFMVKFVQWYNHHHCHSAIRYVTPAQRHASEDVKILQARKEVYERTKAMYPERWTNRATRNWEPIGEVHLNPERAKVQTVVMAEAA